MGEAISFDRFLDLNYLDDADLFKNHDVDKATNKLLEEYKEIAINQVIQNFGLEKILKVYKAGGNVTTFHNYKNRVFSDEESKMKYERQESNRRNFDRKTLDRNVVKRKRNGETKVISRNLENINKRARKEINNEEQSSKDKVNRTSNRQKKKAHFKETKSSTIQIGNIVQEHKIGIGKIRDGYNSENILELGKEPIQLDHIISLKRLSVDDKFNFYLSPDEQSKYVNSHHNLTFTTGPANQSKGANDLQEWSKKSKDGRTNLERFDKNKDDINKKDKQANKELSKRYLSNGTKMYGEKITKTSLKSGAKMGMKEMLGMLIYDLQHELFNEMKHYFVNFKEFNKNKVKWQELKLCFNRVKDKLIYKAKKYLVGFSTGFISGFLGNILTVIINTFKTTYKRLAKLIGETFNGLVKSIKELLSTENEEEKYKEALKKISATVVGALGGMMTESLITYLRTTPFAIFADLIGTTVGGILTGMTVASTMYLIDDIRGFLDSLKGIFIKGKYSQKELNIKFEELLEKIDEEYTAILRKIKREYNRLNELTKKAFDPHIGSSERLVNSSVYASAMNVSESGIVKNIEEIESFFLN